MQYALMMDESAPALMCEKLGTWYLVDCWAKLSKGYCWMFQNDTDFSICIETHSPLYYLKASTIEEARNVATVYIKMLG